MPPAAKLRPVIEEMIHDNKSPREIADRAEDLGFGRDYALQIYRGLTSLASYGDGAAPDREAHAKHLKAVIKHRGFAWYPDALMERVYRLETAPPPGREFWRAA